MKKKLFVFFSFVLLVSLVFISCNKDEQDGITPGFASEQSTGGNPDNTSAGTGGGTTSTTVGSTSTTGGPFVTTGSTTSSSTTSGSTTSTTSTTSSTTTGSTTSPPPSGNWYKINTTLYTCTNVTGSFYNSSWNVTGRVTGGDSCMVSFVSQPTVGATYPIAVDPLNCQPNECVVATATSSASYIANTGNVTVTILSGGKVRVQYTLPDSEDFMTGAPVTLSGDMTTP